MKNSAERSSSQNRETSRFLCITNVIFFFLFSLVVFSLLNPNSTTFPLSASLSSNSTASLSSNSVAFRHLLEVSIKHTIKLIWISQPEIDLFFRNQDLKSQEKMALNDCLDLLDLTLAQLHQAIDDLLASPPSPDFYANLNILLSATMTNAQTCIDGFLDAGSRFGPYIEMTLSPVVGTMRNSMAILSQLEGMSQEGLMRSWMSKGERRMMLGFRIRANVVVARDGSGDFKTIGEAVKMAPNMSLFRYVIKIGRGTYTENVEIPRNKLNIMLVGDGINSTVISGSRNAADGFSTFKSATLSVAGHRFIARDLTVENTATPDKHQAVAVKVSSNAAFYRCNFSSYQDTLYAYSFIQLYRECIIQGTVDFIFGNAAAVFQKCLILARKPIPGQSNMITAQSRDDPHQNTGFLIQNCRIQASPELTLWDQRQTYTFLGRPWRNYSRTVITQSYLGNLIHPLGWAPWDEYSNLDIVEYVENLNFGPGSVTKYRVRWGGYKNNCTGDLASRFTVGAFLRDFDHWVTATATGLPQSVQEE